MNKTVWLIRHPSVVWSRYFFEKALPFLDIQTFCPIDEKGWGMTRHLSRYLKGLNKPFGLFTSPLKRASNMADCIGKSLEIEAVSIEPFGEIFTVGLVSHAFEIIEKSKNQVVHPVRFCIEKAVQKAKKNRDFFYFNRLSQKGLYFESALTYSRPTSQPEEIVCTHSFIMGVVLWRIENPEAPLNRKSMPRILEITGNIPYTGISKIVLKGDKWEILSIGKTPHLESYPELVGGTFN